jgi:hypothetical protein
MFSDAGETRPQVPEITRGDDECIRFPHPTVGPVDNPNRSAKDATIHHRRLSSIAQNMDVSPSHLSWANVNGRREADVFSGSGVCGGNWNNSFSIAIVVIEV